MKIINSDTARVRPSILVHGLTGGGKSTFAETGGSPLVILTEIKAESVLKQVNPSAVGLVPESLDDLEHLFEMLGRPEKMTKFDRIILDSFTELTLVIPRWIKAKQGQTGTLVKLELSEFGHLRDYALALVKAIQLTGLPSVIIVRSTSKRVGLSERIVPDGMGKSVEELPGKLLPTAEARFDPELGYVIDTTPAEHSQRCGLPWVPAIYQGTCLDYLRIIEAGPQEESCATATPAPATAAGSPSKKETATSSASPEGNGVSSTPSAASKPEPSETPSEPETSNSPSTSSLPTEPDPAWVEALVSYATITKHLPDAERKAAVQEWERHYAADPAAAQQSLGEYLAVHGMVREKGIDPEQDPEGYRKAFGEMCAQMQAAKSATAKAKEHAPEVKAFVDGVSPEVAQKDDVSELLALAGAHKVNLESLWKYALHKKSAKPMADGSKNWSSLAEKFVSQVSAQLKDEAKRRAFVPFLHQTYK